MELPIIVRNRLTAYAAAKACVDRGLSLLEGQAQGLWAPDQGWGWTVYDIVDVALDNKMVVRVGAPCVIHS